jgi:hypothetical protein
MSDMAEGWDHDLGGVFSGRAERERARYNISLPSAGAVGSPARRELTRSHANTDGRNSRSQTRRLES